MKELETQEPVSHSWQGAAHERLSTSRDSNQGNSSFPGQDKYNAGLVGSCERYERVVNKLVEYITDENLRPGEKLLPESEMCSMLGVGARSLREALVCLRGVGLVQSHHGKGWYVEHFDPACSLRFLSPIIKSFSDVDISDVMQMRLANEPLIAKLAAEHISPEGLVFLAETMGRMMESGAGKKLDEFRRHDKEFHDILARECGNRFMTLVSTLMSGFYYSIQSFAPDGNYEDRLRQHRKIYHAIVKRDADEAEQAMKEHLTLLARFLLFLEHGIIFRR